MGQRNLVKASADVGVPVTIQWLPFFLDPSIPPEGRDLREHIANKYGREAVYRFIDNPANPLDAAGRKVGISFNNSRRVINTIDCHRVMEWCYQNHPEKGDELMSQMFHAYFEEARDLSKKSELIKVVEAVGLESVSIASLLDTNSLKVEVAQKEREYKRNLKISGVPFFIIENNNGGRPTAFSGAQVRFKC